jgi:hypothetical protein
VKIDQNQVWFSKPKLELLFFKEWDHCCPILDFKRNLRSRVLKFFKGTFGLVLKSCLWIESPWKLTMKHTIRCMKAWHLKHWTYIPVLSNSQDENLGIYQCWASTKPWFRTDPIFSWSSSKELVGYHVRCYLGWYPDFWISNFR